MSSPETRQSTNRDPSRERLTPVRVLIVEDDVTMEPLWRYIIEVASPGAIVEWITTGEAAEQRIQMLQAKEASRFDLIVADIFLNGEKTGLDLWESNGEEKFVLMSVLSPQRLKSLALNIKRPLPGYLQKPLDPGQCIETVRVLLES